MHGFLHSVAAFFFSLGGIGLLLLGVLDSSFLFMPLGNDLLVIALTATHRSHMPYYVAMATAGSVVGVAITAWVSGKGGEAIEHKKKSRRIEYVERKINERGGLAIGVATLMPPPFPFTPFVIVAAALQYPRKKMLAIVAAGRAIRFFAEGGLALIYGKSILNFAKSPWLERFVIALVVISLAGSILSVVGWIRKSRRAA